MREEMSKKQVKKGPKSKVLIGLKRETGRPQAIKNGNDIKLIKSCNCILLSMFFCQRDTVFIGFSLIELRKKVNKTIDL